MICLSFVEQIAKYNYDFEKVLYILLRERKTAMGKLTIDDIKTKISPICEKYDVARAYLFGSYARSEATEESDVDIRIDKGTSQKLRGLFDVSGFQLELSAALEKQVDLITLLPDQAQYAIFRDDVTRDEVLLYESKQKRHTNTPAHNILRTAIR